MKSISRVKASSAWTRTLPRKAQLLTIVRRHEHVSERGPTIPAVEHVADAEHLAARLRHLATLVEQEVLDVHPDASELDARCPFGLGNLVFVVREDQVDTAGVNIDWRITEKPKRHRRALDVPAWAAGTHPEIPRRLFGRRGLPENEVTGIVLLVLVGIDPRPRLDAVVVQASELAVVRLGVDLEVDRAIAAVACGRVPQAP